MQNYSSDGVTLRARLNEILALMEAATARGDKDVAQRLRIEREPLENSVPILEAEAQRRHPEALVIQIALGEHNLIEAETTLRQAIQASDAAKERFEAQKHPLEEALNLAKTNAAQM